MDTSGQRRAERDGSSAWRRRQRRLRSWWRHEQQSIAMSLAAAQHHCAKQCWARVAQRSTEPEHCQGGDGVLRDVRGLRCGGWWPAAVSRGGCGSRTGCRGILWSRSSKTSSRCRFSVDLCRSLRWVGCKTKSCSEPQCPRFPSKNAFLVERLLRFRRRRNSWWKCLSLSPPSTGPLGGDSQAPRSYVAWCFEWCLIPSRGATASPGGYSNTGQGSRRRPWYRTAAVPAVQAAQAVLRQRGGHFRFELVRTVQIVQRIDVCDVPRRIWALSLRNAWLDSGYMFCPSWWFC